MASKKLSFNFRFIGRDVLRHWPIWASMMFTYLLCITGLTGFLQLYEDTVIKDVIQELLDISQLMSIFLGILVAYFAFGFLGSKKSHYFFEVLPMNKTGLFINRFIFGYIIMFIPNLFIFIVEIIQIKALTGETVFAELACWLLIIAAQNLFWLSFGTLFMVLCGRKLMGAVCYYCFAIFGFLVQYTYAVYNSFMFIGTELQSPGKEVHIGILSPLTYVFNLSNVKSSYGIEGLYGTGRLITVFIAFIVIFILSYLLFVRRKAERTGDNIVFSFMKKIFSWCFTFVFAIELTMFMLGIISNGATGFTHYTGYKIACVCMILGFSVIGYFISCMIIDKKFNIFKKYLVQALICSCVFALIMIIYMFDIFGVEKHIPETEDIASASISINLTDNDQKVITYRNKYKKSLNDEELDSENRIITEIHNIILKHMDELIATNKELGENRNSSYTYYDEEINMTYTVSGNWRNDYLNNVYIKYWLKNGDDIVRNYDIMKNGKITEEIKTFISKNPEYFVVD